MADQRPTNINVLTVCSRNQWRSPTAEKLINALPGYRARSAGTETAARVQVSAKHIVWAEIILVMEHRHARRLREMFGEALTGKTIHCLDVPDDFEYMDPELVELLHQRLTEVLSTET
jgi:predicted protein tyrosine phosphatase